LRLGITQSSVSENDKLAPLRREHLCLTSHCVVVNHAEIIVGKSSFKLSLMSDNNGFYWLFTICTAVKRWQSLDR